MNPDSIARSSSLLVHLVDPAVRSLAIGIAAALLLRIFRVKNPPVRLAVWTGVLYAALAMPLLAPAIPPLLLPIPVSPLFAKTTSAAAIPFAAPKADSANIGFPTNRLDSVQSSGFVARADSKALSRSASHTVPSSRAASRLSESKNAALGPIAFDRGRPSRGSVNLAATRTAADPAFPWTTLAAVIFCVVALLMFARVVVGSIVGGRLARSAQTIADCDAIRILLRQARIGGVLSPPRLGESDVISVPLTLGIFRPAILLPSYWRRWDEPTLSAVIAHEVSHIARRDALTQRLALIHRALFWFSPLSWWLYRALMDAAEEASDEAALLAGADRAFYAETLLRFFAALSESSGRVYWQGVSMASPGEADRRVDRILSWKGAVSMRIRKSFVAGLAVLGVPLVLLTAAARPSTSRQDSTVPAAPAVPGFLRNHATRPEAPVHAVAVLEPAPVIPAAADPIPALAQAARLPAPSAGPQNPEPPVEPPAPLAPGVSAAKPTPTMHGGPNSSYKDQIRALQEQINQEVREQMKQLKDDKQWKQSVNGQVLKSLTMRLDAMPKIAIQPFDFNFQMGAPVKINIGDDGNRFVIVSNDSPVIMSGDSEDVEHATALRSKISGDFIWFQHDEKSYIIHDQATVNQAKALFKAQQDLDQKQQALGKQMRDLGDQMRALGQKMRDVHVTVPDLSAQMEKLEVQMKQLSTSGGTEQEVGELQRQLGELMRQIGQTQSQAGDQQRQIGEQMRALGDQQRTLGDQMRQIGDQERDASRQAHTQMDQLLNDAISKGSAQPE